MKVNVALVLAVGPVGPLPIVVSGAVVSTVNERAAGRGVDGAGGVDRAHLERVRALGLGRDRVGRGAGREPAAAPTRHWKVEPGSVDVNVKVGVGSFVSPVGPPVIVVFGGPRRVDHERARRHRRVGELGADGAHRERVRPVRRGPSTAARWTCNTSRSPRSGPGR